MQISLLLMALFFQPDKPLATTHKQREMSRPKVTNYHAARNEKSASKQ